MEVFEKMFNDREAAALIGCSAALLRKWRSKGGGPVYCKIGRLVRYQQADIDAFLVASRIRRAQ